MITHTVILRLGRPVAPGAIEDVLAKLRSFAAEAPHALGPAVVREDLALRPEGRSSSEALMEARFASAEDFRSYLADPKHVALVEQVLVPNCEAYLSVQSDSATP